MAEAMIQKRTLDVLTAFGILGVLATMILPLPTWLLSFLLILNLAMSVTVLLVVLNIREILDFSIFPSVLLGLTLFRLALNVASTKRILMSGDAGAVIEAFGQIVVRGDAVVGFVVFLILVVVQFLVITKGAERVSEVAARFTLDALPGKQMAIDAELNAGLIDEKTATQRRQNIQREADFYGAMDGASKFVRGDAIAAIMIVGINILGGAILGFWRRHMDLADVLRTYTVLSIGDGLVHQIPALIVSTASGVLVTRSATQSPLGQEWARQISANPRALGMAGFTMSLLGVTGLFTGLPVVPFLVVGGTLAAMAWVTRPGARPVPAPAAAPAGGEKDAGRAAEDLSALLAVEPLELELGYGLLFLVDTGQGGDLLNRVVSIRRRCARELGFVLPPVRIRDSSALYNNTYVVKIKGAEVARGDLMPGYCLAMGGDGIKNVRGLPAKEPTFGLPALWVAESDRRTAEMEGLTVVDNASVVATHLTEVLRDHAHEILGRQEVQTLLNDLKARGQTAVIEELIPGVLSAGAVHRVLQNLLNEKVSIRNLLQILEALSEAAGLTKDPDLLTEYARASLARQISQQYRDEEGTLYGATLSPDLERRLHDSMPKGERTARLVLDPALSDDVARRLLELFSAPAGAADRPVLLCSASLRAVVRRHFERFVPRLTVLSYNEITADTRVKSIGVVGVESPLPVAS